MAASTSSGYSTLQVSLRNGRWEPSDPRQPLKHYLPQCRDNHRDLILTPGCATRPPGCSITSVAGAFASAASASSLSNIVISNITARSDSPICNSITGIPGEYTCRIKRSHLNFECPGGTAEMATRPIPENIRGYPENRMFGPSLPAYGLYIRHIRDLTLDDISFTLLHPDARPVVVLEDVQQVRLSGLTVDAPTGGAPAVQVKQAKSLFLEHCRVRAEEKRLVSKIANDTGTQANTVSVDPANGKP